MATAICTVQLIFVRLIFATWAIGEKFLTSKIFQSTVHIQCTVYRCMCLDDQSFDHFSKKNLCIYSFCTEPVAVGIVVKNPLAISLLMTRFTLVWQFTTSSSTPLMSPKSTLSPSSSVIDNDRGSPPSEERSDASCQVIECIELNPNEQRMVSRQTKFNDLHHM